MIVDIKKCDINNDYFHFTNKRNIDSILNNGLIPQVGTASKLVDDRANVSISKGGKGIMGIINSFIFKFENEMKISDIPEEYRKYFTEIDDFTQSGNINTDIACKAMRRKLSDEVYFRVIPTEEQLKNAKIGGFTGYDVNLPDAIGNHQIDIVTDSNNKVLSALDVARYVYEKARDIEEFREMHPGFFHMFELDEKQIKEKVEDDIER